jgi:hypothetical protein
MKRLYAIFISLLSVSITQGQNLVPNPSFETYVGCGGNSAISSGTVSFWNRPPGSIITPDLFTSCATSGTSCSDFNVANNCVGNSVAFHGGAYAGQLWYYTGCPNCKEYIQAALTPFPVNGTVYRASYRTKLGPLCSYGTNRHGMYISALAPSQPGGNQPILVTPTIQRAAQVLDKVNWTPVSGTFTSNGLERYVTIGNFYNDASTTIASLGAFGGSCIFGSGAAYYYIDSVNVIAPSVLPVEIITLSGNATVSGNELTWQIETDVDLRMMWVEHSTDENHFSPVAEFYDPTTFETLHHFTHESVAAGNNFYRIGYETTNGEFNVSEIVALNNTTHSPFAQVSLSPNPAYTNSLLEVFFPKLQQNGIKVSVNSLNGETISEYSYPLEDEYSFSLNLEAADFPAGVYLVKIQTEDFLGMKRWVVVK